MMKAILLLLGAFVGSVLGVLIFLVIDFRFHPPFAVYEPGVWTEYGPLILGGVGAMCGVVMGRAACVWINKPRVCAPVPSEIPPADVTVQSRRNIRPLTWRYRV
jgi:ABC-type branched-subunit amino acid transport system permease subunit